jgi:hypothetical protein
MRTFAARLLSSQRSKLVRNSGGFGIRWEKPKKWKKGEFSVYNKTKVLIRGNVVLKIVQSIKSYKGKVQVQPRTGHEGPDR